MKDSKPHRSGVVSQAGTHGGERSFNNGGEGRRAPMAPAHTRRKRAIYRSQTNTHNTGFLLVHLARAGTDQIDDYDVVPRRPERAPSGKILRRYRDSTG